MRNHVLGAVGKAVGRKRNNVTISRADVAQYRAMAVQRNIADREHFARFLGEKSRLQLYTWAIQHGEIQLLDRAVFVP